MFGAKAGDSQSWSKLSSLLMCSPGSLLVWHPPPGTLVPPPCFAGACSSCFSNSSGLPHVSVKWALLFSSLTLLSYTLCTVNKLLFTWFLSASLNSLRAGIISYSLLDSQCRARAFHVVCVQKTAVVLDR